jgi:8-oxo-dGTP pyrophosphatase MutT (NUDIX family)
VAGGELRVPEGEVANDAVREQTGLSVVRVARDLGRGFVQATPAVESPDEWRHGDVAVRWVPISADLRLAPPLGKRLAQLLRKRVVAYVTRERGGRTELLVFDEQDAPDVPTQVPAGRIDSHESLEEGLHREVEEETGLTGIQLVAELAGPRRFESLYGPGAHESHAFHAVAEAGGPDAWEHAVTGTGMDAGFVFLCRWVPLDDCPPLWGEADPLVDELRRSIPKP